MEDSVIKILDFNQPLLKNMVDYKFGLMSDNIYSFFRGTSHLYFDDLAKEKKLPFSPSVWICGDLHMENFGSFKGDNRLVYFDLNDFDEALLAPAAWEISRFITSLFIGFETLEIEETKALNMARLFMKTYSQTLAIGKPRYLEPKISKGIVCSFLTEARDRKNKKLLDKRTVRIGNKRKIRHTEKHLKIDKVLKKELISHLNGWVHNHTNSPNNYEVIDVAFRIAGLGSIGLKRYLFLLRSTNLPEKYLLVDMKQSRSSSLLPNLDIRQPAWTNDAERIIEIQKRMQNISPALLSTTYFKDECYVIQEMQSAKDGIKLDLIKNRYRDMYQVIDDMAMLTASAQLRSSGRQNSANVDELMLFGQNQTWQEEVLDYALKYTAIVKKDFLAFRKSRKR